MATLMGAVNGRYSLTVPESITRTGTLSPPSQQEAGLEEDALEKQLFLPCKGHWTEAQIHLFLGELADTSQLAFPCALAGLWPAAVSLPRMRRRALKSSTRAGIMRF